MIETMPFGRTGRDSSRVIFGAAALGSVTQDEADQTMELVRQHRVNHLDTAASYGDAELRLGPWMADHRSEYFLATKTGERTAEAAWAEINRSLERLQTDHVDLIQLHNLVDEDEWRTAYAPGGVLEAAVRARDEGLTRFIGVTGHGVTVARQHLRSLGEFDFDSVLLPYNFPMSRNTAYLDDFEALAAVCAQRGVAMQTIKSITKAPWSEGVEQHAATWYEPLKDPAAFRRLGIRPAKGFLLYGPPGTGKTLLAKATAREAEANFIATKSSDLLSKWYGESEQQIARLFARARQVAPTVIFIDELDSLVPARGGGIGEPQVTERVVNTILAEMDGLEEMGSVVVIGATNRPNLIDPALLRPGRFDELIYVAVPEREGRRHILGIHTGKMPLAGDVDLDSLAARTERFTGADLEDLVRRAGLFALRESMGATEVTHDHFERALKETRASVTPEMEKEYEKIQDSLKQDAMSSSGGIGFVSPGMLSPRGPKGVD